MANTSNSDKWYFTKVQLESTPSRKCGLDAFKELSYRQQAANFIQDMGQKLKVSQLCINTAIVYMHRFYVFHSFTHFPWHQMAAAALFLAAKVEEQPRKLEYVIKIANVCRNTRDNLEVTPERLYQAQSQDLVFNENVLLQTLGFDVAIDHPHTHVVRCCHLVRASKELAKTSYFMASNSLHLTTMCIQYKPTVVACFSILVACKWANWEIPLSNENKEWYSYVDPTVTADLLQQLTEEFLVIFETCPSRLKEKIMAIADNIPHMPSPHMNSPFDTDPKKIIREDGKDNMHLHRTGHDSKSDHDLHKHRSRPHEAGSSSQQQREREYREMKERELLLAQQMQHGQKPLSKSSAHGHHRQWPVDQKMKQYARPPSSSNYLPPARIEPRDILREATRVDSPFGLANKDYREHGKDPREVQKTRDYLLKPNVTESNSLNNYGEAGSLPRVSVDKLRMEQSRRVDMSKIPGKHDGSMRRYDDSSKVFPKSESDNMKKHLSASGGLHDKNSAYMNKSTSQKLKSPPADTSKSVPKPNVKQPLMHKSHHHNGSSNGNTTSYTLDNEKLKKELYLPVKDEITSLPPAVKRPGLFSPEKTPPKMEPTSPKLTNEQRKSTNLLSPLESPANKRHRNYSSSSEPELRPVMTKIDQVEGFENLMRDSTIGINKLHQIPDMITPIADVKKEKPAAPNYSKEMKPPDIILPLDDASVGRQIVALNQSYLIGNGIETNPALISNLLKEVPAVSHLQSVGVPVVPQMQPIASGSVVLEQPGDVIVEAKEKTHHQHKSKKKNKEKHKHKDKDKNREDKEKKKKHKDKDREKHKHRDKTLLQQEIVVNESSSSHGIGEPIKIKIHKDKIQPMPENPGAGTLKIKIPKDKIKTETIAPGESSSHTTTLKIKIPKDVINNCNNSGETSGSSSGRKRDRSSPSDAPPNKLPKTAYNKDASRRHQYKVAQMGDGDTSLHRLAESKYINKGSSS